MQRLQVWWYLISQGAWKYVLGTVSALGIIDTILSHIFPDYRPAIISEILPDWWTWQVWLIAVLFIAFIATLDTAYRRIRQLSPTTNIRLVFDETRPEYIHVREGEETYSIGVSAIGGKIENPEVFVSRLLRVTPPREVIKIPRLRLTPIVSHSIINPGNTPTYFVDVFRHKRRQRKINFCFSGVGESTELEYGLYELRLRARGSNIINSEIIELLLRLDENNNIEIEQEE
jgi:hypothetical protein